MHEVEAALGEEEFCWGLPAEGLSGSYVEQPGDVVELILGEAAEVLSFGQVLAQLGVEAVEDVGEAVGGDLGAPVVEWDEGDEEGGAFDESADARAVEPAFDEVAFPVAGDKAEVDLVGAVIDQSDRVLEGALGPGGGARFSFPAMFLRRLVLAFRLLRARLSAGSRSRRMRLLVSPLCLKAIP